MIFPAITITDSTPFTLDVRRYAGSTNKITALWVWNDTGGSVVYHGPVLEDAAFSMDLTADLTNKNKLTMVAYVDANPNFVGGYVQGRNLLGWTWSAASPDADDDGNFVVGQTSEFLEFRRDFVNDYAIAAVTLTPPAVTSDNGIPILANNGFMLVADQANRFLNHPRKFVVATGGNATLRISIDW